MIALNNRILTGTLLVLLAALSVAATPLSVELDVRVPVCPECPVEPLAIAVDRTAADCNRYPHLCCPACRKSGSKNVF